MPDKSSALLAAYHQHALADLIALLADRGFRSNGPTMLSSSTGVTVAVGGSGTRLTFQEPTGQYGMGIVDFPAGTNTEVIAAVATALHVQAAARRSIDHQASTDSRMGQDGAGDRPIAVVRLSAGAVSTDADPVDSPGRIQELLGDDLTEMRLTVCPDGVWLLAESRTDGPEYLRVWTPPHRRTSDDD